MKTKKRFTAIIFIVLMQFILFAEIQSQVKDYEGNTYKTVKIEKREWMAENLNTEHYRNGDLITQVQDTEEWKNLKTGAWCYYENNTSEGKIYGKLYNWYAVNDVRGLAPDGWYIPSDIEWKSLEDYNGGYLIAGEKMKSISGWDGNKKGSDLSGFTGLPGGFRNFDGLFHSKGGYGYWWSLTEYADSGAWFRVLCHIDDDLARDRFSKKTGFSVRCIKD